ncbi:uncharacterized protein LOC118470476 isoform X2 [Amphiprion ocellaris]|nr:uncharacterized protein LOC118470476 isoform X2 [Amphiprion ocellaris]
MRPVEPPEEHYMNGPLSLQKKRTDDRRNNTSSRHSHAASTSSRPSIKEYDRASDTELKRQQKMLTKKVELLNMLKEERSYATVGRHYGINESSVHYIKKDEKNVRMMAAMSFNKTAKRVITSCNKAVVRMESALALWISHCRKKNIPLDTINIRTKAKMLIVCVFLGYVLSIYFL